MSAPPDSPPVGRLAPSPTGLLHLGHARSFLLAWWSIRSRGGRILLRIEDLDHARVKAGAVDACLRDLEWLGLDWDGEPLLQSADTGPLERAVDQLLESGQAYACTCTRNEIRAALSAPHADDAEMRYAGTCRDRYASPSEARGAAGIRLRVEPGVVAWNDELAGPQASDVDAEVGDFLLARRDQVFAYQLACVVDDARQGVTEILRGADLIPSTARQLLLQRALGLPSPRWLHAPLVVDPTGARLSKRRGDLGLTHLRESGLDARRVVNWVAGTIALATDGLQTATEVLPRFRRDQLPPTPVRFGPGELEAILGNPNQGLRESPTPHLD